MNIREKISDDELVTAFNSSSSKNEMLKKLNLPCNGTN